MLFKTSFNKMYLDFFIEIIKKKNYKLLKLFYCLTLSDFSINGLNINTKFL